MTHLYSCRHDGDQYRITKLDHNMEAESSYLVSATECQCPGFERRNHCRHLDMLPRFIARDKIGGAYLHDFERNAWVRNPLIEHQALPEDITLVSLDNPETLFNTIADAVGEARTATNPLRRV